MKCIKNSLIPLARRRTAIAAADYTEFTDVELIAESIGLHSALATAGDFGRVAELGIRATVIERLLLIDREHQRRATASTTYVAPVQAAA